MKKSDSNPIISGSLSSLIEKFSQSDVIAEMEKEYQSAPAKLISISLIDDTSFVKDVPMRKETISYFAAGLKAKGFYNPLVVREKNDGRYEVILGRKRFFGAKEAGILSLPCAIVEAGDEETLLMLLADTRDQRESNVLEMAYVCFALETNFHYSQKMLADLSHQSRSQITNILRLLKLPPQLREEIGMGQLSYGHARALLSLKPTEIEEARNYIRDHRLSVREAERYCASLNKTASKPIKSPKPYLKGKRIELTFQDEKEAQAYFEKHFRR